MEEIELRVFVEVVRCGSMSQAAAALHMGQSAVSQRIQLLEATVGRKLFIRQHRGVKLTPAGEELFSYAERALVMISEGLAAARSIDSKSLHIRIAAPPSVNSYFLGPLLEHLALLGHNVTLLDAHSHDVIQHLYDGMIDAGFVLSSPAYPGLQITDIWEDPLVCVASKQHRLAQIKMNSIPLALLAGERIIWYRYSRFASTFREQIERAIDAPYPCIESTPADTVKSLVLKNIGIGFLPRLAVNSELQSRELVALPLQGLVQVAWQIQFVSRARKYSTRQLDVLTGAIQELWEV